MIIAQWRLCYRPLVPLLLMLVLLISGVKEEKTNVTAFLVVTTSIITSSPISATKVGGRGRRNKNSSAPAPSAIPFVTGGRAKDFSDQAKPTVHLSSLLLLAPPHHDAYYRNYHEDRNLYEGGRNSNPINNNEDEKNDNKSKKNSPETSSSSSLSMHSFATTFGCSLLFLSLWMWTPFHQQAKAYEMIYPIELRSSDEGSILDSRQRKLNEIQNKNQQQPSSSLPEITSTITTVVKKQFMGETIFTTTTSEYIIQKKSNTIRNQLISTPVASTMWAISLWLLLGSRSNPFITPLANILYDPNKESWLQDRNEGYFADLPIPFFIFLAIAFVTLGIGVNNFICMLLLDGDIRISIQLAGISMIGGAFWELGRIATGEKQLTRMESNRIIQLQEEFNMFAQQRLLLIGDGIGTSTGSSTSSISSSRYSCHRSDIIKSFRRFYAKYRQSDSSTYPLSDLEIEQLIKHWIVTRKDIDMRAITLSPAGFYSGIQINKDADITT